MGGTSVPELFVELFAFPDNIEVEAVLTRTSFQSRPRSYLGVETEIIGGKVRLPSSFCILYNFCHHRFLKLVK